MAGHNPSVLGDFVIETSSGRWLRAYGALPHPNMLAGWLAVCLVIFLGFFLLRKKEGHPNFLFATGAMLVIIINFIGLILTFSRSVWLAFALIMILMMTWVIRQKDRYRTRVLAAVIATMLLVVMASYFMMPSLWQTRVSGGRLEAKSATERLTQFQQVRAVITDFWYQGAGLNAYTAALYNRDTTHPVWEYQPVHNIYLLVIAEAGIFGGLIFLLIVGRFLVAAFSEFFRPNPEWRWPIVSSLAFVAVLAIGLFDHYLWSLSFGVMLFWLLFGLWENAVINGNLTVDKSG